MPCPVVLWCVYGEYCLFFFQAEDGIRDYKVTGVQTCALPISALLRGRGIRTTILSTGLLLERNAARIAEGVDEVIVSLDGPAKIHDEIRRVPGPFDLLAKGVRAVHRISPEFPISARCTVQ